MSGTYYQTPGLLQPPSIFSGDDLQRIEAEVNSTVQVKLTLYEELANRYHDHPYLLVRIAAVYESSRCFSMAEDIYRKTRSKIREMGSVDQVLERSLEKVTREALKVANHYMELDRYLLLSPGFKQPWKTTKEYPFPTGLPRAPEGHEEVHREWNSLPPDSGTLFMKYLRKLAIETNEVENTFRLTTGSIHDLIRYGISEGAILSKPESLLHDTQKIKDILWDTLAAYDLVKPLVAGPDVTLNPKLICDIHARLMKTGRFNPSGTETTVSGKTRTFTRKNVAIRGSQCCPFPRVDQELEHICKMANQWIVSWKNPFATASWLHLIFVNCHPFEDGNGRLGRLLASIPLMRHRYPPIVISLEDRDDYFNTIKKALDNDHRPSVNCILKGMQDTLESVKRLS